MHDNEGRVASGGAIIVLEVAAPPTHVGAHIIGGPPIKWAVSRRGQPPNTPMMSVANQLDVGGLTPPTEGNICDVDVS